MDLAAHIRPKGNHHLVHVATARRCANGVIVERGHGRPRALILASGPGGLRADGSRGEMSAVPGEWVVFNCPGLPMMPIGDVVVGFLADHFILATVPGFTAEELGVDPDEPTTVILGV